MADGIDIKVKVDTRAFAKAMKGFEKHMPFAIALALTRTAADCQTVLKSRLDSSFTVRTPWVAKGIRIEGATKTNLRAKVGSIDRFMEPQAIGGGKKPHEGKLVGVPMVGRGLPRSNLKSVTRPSKWPGGYMATGKTFIGTLRTDEDALWARITRGKGKNRREGLRLLYVMKPEVHIPARWPIRAVVGEVVANRWPDHTLAAIKQAIDTARK